MTSTGRIVADTNVVSYLMKGTEFGQRYKHHLEGKIVGIAFVTVAEMHYWAERKNWGEKRRQALEAHLKNYVVLPYNNDIAKLYARIVVARERQGRPISWPDAWIAAIALWHDAPLVTHDGDFAGIVRGLFDAYYLDTAKRGFAALENGGVLTASAAVHYALPNWQTIADVTRSYPYQHSVFERVDNLNNEERALANALDAMPEIVWWQRNADRGQFALKAWHPHTFNPDFLARLTNGLDVLLEYKGADRATDDQTRWKNELGFVWESLDPKKRFFRTVTKANLETVVAELKAKGRT